MKTSETLSQVALAKPRRTHGASRFADANERSDLLASILSEETTPVERAVPLALVRGQSDAPDLVSSSSIATKRPRYLKPAIGAAVLSLVAVILLAVGASPGPVQLNSALKRIVVVQQSNDGLGLPEPVYPVQFQLTIDPSLSSATGTSPAYSVTWPMDAHTSAVQLAQAFGVPTNPEAPFVVGGVTFGPSSGPSVRVEREDGLLTWEYDGSPATRAPLSTPPSGDTGASSSAGTPPSNAEAIAQTRAYLATLNLASNLGSPQISDFNGQVGVVIPIVANSVETNMSFNFIYGPGDTLEMATGVFAAVALIGDYPTISQTSAVGLLQSQPASEPLAFLTDCPDNAQGIHVCSGAITSADLGYRTFESQKGEVLLPMWFLMGPRDGGNPDATTLGGVVNAIDPAYLRIDSPRTTRRDGGM